MFVLSLFKETIEHIDQKYVLNHPEGVIMAYVGICTFIPVFVATLSKRVHIIHTYIYNQQLWSLVAVGSFLLLTHYVPLVLREAPTISNRVVVVPRNNASERTACYCEKSELILLYEYTHFLLQPPQLPSLSVSAVACVHMFVLFGAAVT